MGDVRDPETDQPAPKPGGVPVQAVLIEALKQRMAFGLKKYDRPLETHNGRDPLRDMWEEMLDMVSYFTQYILEQGVEIPGLEQFIVKPKPEGAATQRGPRFDLMIIDEIPRPSPGPEGLVGESPLVPSICTICHHGPHVPGFCEAQAWDGLTNCMCGVPHNRVCSNCKHGPHSPGRCRSQALNLGCSCVNEDQSS